MSYADAALAVIMHLQTWIAHNDPGRTAPLAWEEVTSNLDHLADDEGFQPAKEMIVRAYFPEREEWAVATVHCETGGTWNTWAVNRAGPYHNLFQVLNGTLGHTRQGVIEAKSIADSAESQGRAWWRPWPNCGRNRFR